MNKHPFYKTINKIIQLDPDDQELVQACELILNKLDQYKLDSNNGVKPQEHNLKLPDEIQLNHQIAIFSDGACRGNPGPGSWACIGQNAEGELIFESASFDESTTNNKMELTAAIQGLQAAYEYHQLSYETQPHFFLYTDSQYVKNGMTQWMENWKRKSWKKSDGKAPENIELWKELDEIMSTIGNIEVKWVKGHSGHPQNEYCDRLCNTILDQENF